MKNNSEISKQVKLAIAQAHRKQNPVILEKLIKEYGINRLYDLIMHFNVGEHLITTTILDSLLSGKHTFMDQVYLDLNPTILKDVSYYELLLARGAIAPIYEINCDGYIYRKIPLDTKSKYFTNKIFNMIIEGGILSSSTEMYCHKSTNYNYNKTKSYKCSIIFNRLKYLISDCEATDYLETGNPFDLLIFEFKATDIFNNLTDNIRRNELALLKDKSFDLKKLLDFKKIIFDQLTTFSHIYCSLDFESNFNKNLHFMKLIKNRINLPSNKQEDNIDFKLLALLKRIYEDKPIISASLIYIYLPEVTIDKIIKTINDNFFKFRWKVKENTFFPTEIQIQIATSITAEFAEELAKYFPYQNYFDSNEHHLRLCGDKPIVCDRDSYSADDSLI